MSGAATVLLLGGSVGDVPLVLGLRDAGCHVAVVGRDTEAPAHRSADISVAADFADAAACEEIALRIGADAVVPGSNDFAAISAARIARNLDLPGHDTVDVTLELNLKERFRSVQDRAGLPVPGFCRIDGSAESRAAAHRLRLPVIVKPTDLTGGKGIRTVDRIEGLEGAVSSALAVSRRPEAVVEEYLPGTRHGVTSVVEAGAVTFRFFDDEQYLPGGFRVVGTSTTSLDQHTQDAVVRQLDVLVGELAMVDGLLHAQFIATPDGPVIVEATRRAPGDLYPWFVEAAVDYPYVQAILAPYLGRALPHASTVEIRRSVARWIVVSRGPGRYAGIGIADHLRPAVLRVHEAFREGEEVAASGVTLAIVLLDASKLPPGQLPWDGGAPDSIWAIGDA